jgi:hypothetical protein
MLSFASLTLVAALSAELNVSLPAQTERTPDSGNRLHTLQSSH